MIRRVPWRTLAILALVAVPSIAFARPGGGDSYSGGGGHGGGGSGGGGGGGGGDAGAIFELILQLIRLCLYYPKIGIPLVVLIFGFIIWSAYKKQQNKDWDSGPPVALRKTIPSLAPLLQVDPDFSRILFEDFTFRLYATAQEARGVPGKLDELGPYLAAPARQALAERKPVGQPVGGVVIGAMRTYRVDVPDTGAIQRGEESRVRIGLDIEANYSVGAGKQQKKLFAVESWLLSRNVAVRTRPPTARTFPCPNCGAPWQDADASRTQRCAYCGQVVDNGRFDWQVEQIVLRHEKGGLPSLREDVPERGTDLDTYRARDLDQQWHALNAADPTVTQDAIAARLRHVYQLVNGAWSAGDLRPARGVLSDGIADYFQYWLDAYRAQGLRNVLDKMRITRHELAKVTRDRWYDAVTIRLWGTGRDYVVETGSGRHVRGSSRKDRAYSEYWTLIRASNRRGATKLDGTCGNCGARLAVTAAGACGHCGVHVTAGEFDWVLSRIEQDDSYRG